MKSTIELPDDLFQLAKLTAAKRRITLKTLFTQALGKELNPPANPHAACFRVGEDGLPFLLKRGTTVTIEEIEQLDQESGA